MQPNNLLLAKYHTAGGQNIPNAIATVINYDTLVYDPYRLVTVGAGWVFTANHEGYYFLHACACLDGNAGWVVTEWAYLQMVRAGSGSYILQFRNDIAGGGASVRVFLQGSTLIQCNAGTTIAVQIYQGSGGDIALLANSLYNQISIFKV